MPYAIVPDARRLLADFARKHRGNQRLIDQAAAGLVIIARSPREHIGRIIRLSADRYRYRHGRCRIVYDIDEAHHTVVVVLIDQRDEGTYRDVR